MIALAAPDDGWVFMGGHLFGFTRPSILVEGAGAAVGSSFIMFTGTSRHPSIDCRSLTATPLKVKRCFWLCDSVFVGTVKRIPDRGTLVHQQNVTMSKTFDAEALCVRTKAVVSSTCIYLTRFVKSSIIYLCKSIFND